MTAQTNGKPFRQTAQAEWGIGQTTTTKKMGTGERKNPKSTVFCQEDSPDFRITSALSSQRKVFYNKPTKSSLCRYPKQWLSPMQTIELYFIAMAVSQQSVKTMPRVQLSLSPALQIKRWMISTTVTCTSHCNLKHRHISRRRLLVHNHTRLVMQFFAPPTYEFSLYTNITARISSILQTQHSANQPTCFVGK